MSKWRGQEMNNMHKIRAGPKTLRKILSRLTALLYLVTVPLDSLEERASAMVQEAIVSSLLMAIRKVMDT